MSKSKMKRPDQIITSKRDQFIEEIINDLDYKGETID